jgi:hypothetical protein
MNVIVLLTYKKVSETCSKNASGMIQLCSRYASEILVIVITCFMQSPPKKNAFITGQKFLKYDPNMLQMFSKTPILDL